MDEKYLHTGRWIMFGLAVLILLVGGLGGWAALAPISGAVIAQGTIGVETKIKTIQHLDGGIVEKIFVRDGQQVSSGALLLRLDDTSIRANLAIVTDHLMESLARKARLDAERNGAEKIEFPKELKVKANPLSIGTVSEGQASLFEARKLTREGQANVLRQKIIQLREQIKGLEEQSQSKQRLVDIVKRELEKKRPAAKRGTVSGNTIIRLEQQLAEQTGDYSKLKSQIAQTKSTIEETKLQVLQIDVDFREKVLSELRDTQSKLAEELEQKTALDAKLRRVEIRAPRAGRIHNMSIHTIGGVVSPANPILQIIPNDDRLIIEAKITPTDIDNVKIDQEAGVQLTAFESRTTPMLNGKVKFVSAGQLVDQSTGLTYFTVEILISEKELARLTDGQVLLPGMPAEVFIRTGERTALDMLLKPFISAVGRTFRQG